MVPNPELLTVTFGKRKVGMIEQVEELRTKLQADSLVDPC